jgi:adenosylcobyric acid synthase
MARSLMIQGTGSDVGKSLIVAGLTRAYANRGLSVRPFKPQNMSNNAAVTADGGEIGRAQALQARAARVAPSVHMNPVLLKPQSEVGAQVVVHGKIFGNARAKEFQAWKPQLMASVLASYTRMRAVADLVLIEGAGSASEINLRANDIANMGFARAADLPVVLVGDIDRGGVIAQIVGTKAVVDAEDEKLIAGFIVNKFRGDASLFTDGMRFIEARTGWPALGLVPFFADAARLPAEDAMALARRDAPGDGRVVIAVPLLPHIANFDDLDPLKSEPDMRLVFVRRGEPLPVCDLVLLPGSKATIADLTAFRDNGWDIDLAAHVRRGGRVFGICGGYQMLDVETVLTGDKKLAEISGSTVNDDVAFRGYEMHVGITTGPGTQHPVLRFRDGRVDGAASADGRIAGAYVHGLFNDDCQRKALVARLGATASDFLYETMIDDTLDVLAEHLAAHIDLDRLLSLSR